MKAYLGYILVFLLLSCNSSEKADHTVTIVDGNTAYDVYQPSEMSNLMKGMYAYNEQLKHDIEAGNDLSVQFPDEFLKIHTEQLSETKFRNEAFEHFSSKFIEAQRQVFVNDSLLSIKERYNNSINMCISCHKTECTGPIPKIKRLLIK